MTTLDNRYFRFEYFPIICSKIEQKILKITYILCIIIKILYEIQIKMSLGGTNLFENQKNAGNQLEIYRPVWGSIFIIIY